MTINNKVVIVGAGLGGCLMGILLAKEEHGILLVEKREDPGLDKDQEGRSINMTLSMRGIKALKEAGVFELILPHTVPLLGRMIHREGGKLLSQRYGKNEHEVLYSIKRNIINLLLLNYLRSLDNVTLRFNEQCIDLDKDNSVITTRNTNTNRISRITSSLIIGADGAGSLLRKKLNSSGVNKETMEWGYKEVTLPFVDKDHTYPEEKYLHVWPREKGLLLALPNKDGSLTCTLVLPFRGN